MNHSPVRLIGVQTWAGLVFSGVLFFSPIHGRAEGALKLTFQEETKTLKTERDIAEGRADFGKEPAKGGGVLTVTLGPNRLSVEDESSDTLFDFKSRQMDFLDSAKKTYEESSLFALIGSREEEMGNRLDQRKMLAAAGQNLPEYDVFQLETLFGISDSTDKSETAIFKKIDPNTWEFSSPGGELVSRCEFDQTKVTKEMKTPWRHFLVYGCQLHPSVSAFILKDGRFLKRLWYQSRNIGTAKQVCLRFVKSEEVSNPDEGWKNTFKLAPNCDAGLWAGVLKARAAQVPEALETQKTEQDFMDRAVKQGEFFDAYLAGLENYLQTGVEMTEAQKSLSPKLETDKRFILFQQGLSNSTQAEAQKSVGVLKSIDRTGLSKGYLIDVMLGDAYAASGNRKDAVQSFLTALGKNPLLAGGWKDLGSVYYDDYDALSAWLCWDTARGLYPNHPLLQNITDMEASMVKQYPDFF